MTKPPEEEVRNSDSDFYFSHLGIFKYCPQNVLILIICEVVLVQEEDDKDERPKPRIWNGEDDFDTDPEDLMTPSKSEDDM